MKNSIILMIVGMTFIIGGLLAVKYWILNGWFILVPIGGFAIFIFASMKLIKILENENQ